MCEVLASVGTVWTELTGQLEPGRAIEVKLVAKEKGSIVTRSWDIHIPPDADPTNRWPEQAVWLKSQAAEGTCIASVCSGSVLLASAGFLDGHEATTHWAFTNLFRRLFPLFAYGLSACSVPRRWTHDRHQRRRGSLEYLVLYLIARFAGRARAVRGAGFFHPRRSIQSRG